MHGSLVVGYKRADAMPILVASESVPHPHESPRGEHGGRASCESFDKG
jgi:hypothetical protein